MTITKIFGSFTLLQISIVECKNDTTADNVLDKLHAIDKVNSIPSLRLMTVVFNNQNEVRRIFTSGLRAISRHRGGSNTPLMIGEYLPEVEDIVNRITNSGHYSG